MVLIKKDLVDNCMREGTPSDYPIWYWEAYESDQFRFYSCFEDLEICKTLYGILHQDNKDE